MIEKEENKMSFNLKSIIRDDIPKRDNFYNIIKEYSINSINAILDDTSSENKFISINFFLDKNENLTDIIFNDNGIGLNKQRINEIKKYGTDFGAEKYGCKGIGRFMAFSDFKRVNFINFESKESVGFDEDLTENNEGIFESAEINSNILEAIKSPKTIVHLSKIINIKFKINEVDLKRNIVSSLWMKLFFLYYNENEDESIVDNENYNNFNIELKLFTPCHAEELGFTEKFKQRIDKNDIKKPDNITKLKNHNLKIFSFYIPKQNEKDKNNVFYFAHKTKITEENLGFFKNSLLYKDFDGNSYFGAVIGETFDNIVDKSRTELRYKNFAIKKSEIDNEILEIIKQRLSKFLKKEKLKTEKIVKNIIKDNKFLKQYECKILETVAFEDDENKIKEEAFILYTKDNLEKKGKLDLKKQELDDIIKEKPKLEDVDLFNEEKLKLDNELWIARLYNKTNEITETIGNIEKHNLAQCISEEFRILKMLKYYSKTKGLESFIHQIIYPQAYLLNKKKKEGIDFVVDDENIENIKKEFKEAYSNSNLWLLDDRYLGSDYQYITSNLNIKKFNDTVSLNKNNLKYLNVKGNKAPDLTFFYHSKSGNEEPVMVIELKKPNEDDNYKDAIEEGTEYAKIISSISEKPYTYDRFIVQAIVHSIYDNDVNDFGMIKKNKHYIKTITTKDFYNTEGIRGRDITIIQEIITIERFIELAIKKKALYLKKLGLIKCEKTLEGF